MLRHFRRFAFVGGFVLGIAACGDDDGPSSGPGSDKDAQPDRVDASRSDSAAPEGSPGSDAPTERTDALDVADGDATQDSPLDGGPPDVNVPDVSVDAPPADAGNDGPRDAQPETSADAGDAPVDAGRDTNPVDGSDAPSSPDALDASTLDAGSDTFDAGTDTRSDAAADDAATADARNDASDGDAGVDPFACLGQPLPTTAPPTVQIQGVVATANFMAINGATIDAFIGSDGGAAATATSGVDGTFVIDLTSGGVPVDAYVRATKTGFIDTYHYPSSPIAVPAIGLTVQLIDPATFAGFGQLAGVTPDSSKGSMLILAGDCTGTTVAGATISVAPAGSLVYLNNRVPAPSATSTDADGAAVVFNVPPGPVTVSAALRGMTFRSHVVTVRAGTVTRTTVRP